MDSIGNIYVADENNHAIRKITPSGAVSTWAGEPGVMGSTDGLGSAARFQYPTGLAVNTIGNIYVADTWNHTIRKITPSGMVSTLAGLAGGFGGSADGQGSEARFRLPWGLAVDAAGIVYVADSENNTIRKITPSGMVSTLAGAAQQEGSDNGQGAMARLSQPSALTVDNAGNVYVADTGNYTIRKITSGEVITLAGSAGVSGNVDGPGSEARFYYPIGVAVDTTKNIYVADPANQAIRKITPTGMVSTPDMVEIQAQPASNVRVTLGLSATLTVAAGTQPVSLPLSYQWYKQPDSGTWTAIAGASGATYTTPPTTAEDVNASFYVQVTGGSASASSDVTKLVITETPIFVQNPGDSKADEGSTVTFASLAEGYPVPTYQWQRLLVGTWTDIPNAAGASYTIATVAASDDGARFRAWARNTHGEALSNDATLSVNYIAITSQPVSKTINVGQTATFSIAAMSHPSSLTLSIQWYKQLSGGTWALIPDATGAIYTTPPATAGDANALFYAKVTSGTVSTSSIPAQLIITETPLFNQQPAAAVADEGKTATFTALAGGDPLPVYQWQQLVAGTWTDLVGVTNASYTTPLLTASDDGARFRVWARNSHGEALSSEAVLSVNYIEIRTQPISKAIGIGQTATFSATAVGHPASLSPSIQWFRQPSGEAWAAISGASGNTYTTSAANGGDDQCLYRARFTSGSLVKDSQVVTLTVATQFKFYQQPSNATVREGEQATFTTLVGGIPAPAFQWQRLVAGNWVDIPEATGASYSLWTLLSDQGAQFRVQATNASGTIISEVATLTVNYITITAQPKEVRTQIGQSATFTVEATGNVLPLSYQWYRLSTGRRPEAIPEATLASYTTPPMTLADNFSRYYVAISNGLFTTTSYSARLYDAPKGKLSLLAGTIGGSGWINGMGLAARFNLPFGMAVGAAGNVFVADTANHVIRKITPSGMVSTLAGTVGQPGNADGNGSTARFQEPSGVAVDMAGNVYVGDTLNNTIRKITPSGDVSTLAGTAEQVGSDDGQGTEARFYAPRGIALDVLGNLYVADSLNCTIRKISPGGVVSTLAGAVGQVGSADGMGSTARFREPAGVAVDTAGNVYVGDTLNNTIRKITPSGEVSTLAGTAGQTGSIDGPGVSARFNGPQGVTVDSDGYLYVAESGSHTIRKITPDGVVSTLAGEAGIAECTDGQGSDARFSQPGGVAVDTAGNIYVGDTGNNTIRKITPSGQVSTLVNTLAGAAQRTGSTDGQGSEARFNSPSGVAIDTNGNVYIADTYNHTIRKITPSGTVITLAGAAGQAGSDDGQGANARFDHPKGVAVDIHGNVYVADWYNATIRKITPEGLVNTLAGLAAHGGSTDGQGAAARFFGPNSVTMDIDGNLYVMDAQAIRKITPSGEVSTLAGTAELTGSNDGQGATARFYYPDAVAVDSTGNVYVADTGNQIIRKITPLGLVSTLAGTIWGTFESYYH